MKTTLPKEFICSVFKMWPWPHCFVKIFIHINGGPINVNHVPSLLLSHLFGSRGFFAPPYRTVDITNARWSTSQMHAFVRLTSEVDWGVSTQTESPLLRDLVNLTNTGIECDLQSKVNLTYAHWSTSWMHTGQPHICMHLWGWLVRLTWFILGACRHRLNHPSLGIWSTSLIQVLSVIYSQRSTSHMHIGQPQECRHLGFFALPYRVINLTNAHWSTSQMHAFVRLTISQPHKCLHLWGWPPVNLTNACICEVDHQSTSPMHAFVRLTTGSTSQMHAFVRLTSEVDWVYTIMA